ncbi:hypothetical protein DL546_009753 [Coniochaeta pulveracea]|uniref:Uncharacterized protein n=1 Tax=Coniochaeta pulveracea TaxID=177199 RepID=A0A420YMB7_9PEZI|nr:hypothetical protein DL546_009753 [Coniochaeta pulveracea]
MFGPPSLGKFACGTKKTTGADSSGNTLTPRPKSLLFQRMSQIEATQPNEPAEPEPVSTNQDEADPELDDYPDYEVKSRPTTAENERLGLVEYTSVFDPAEKAEWEAEDEHDAYADADDVAPAKKEDEEDDEEEHLGYTDADEDHGVKHGWVSLVKGKKGKNGKNNRRG